MKALILVCLTAALAMPCDLSAQSAVAASAASAIVDPDLASSPAPTIEDGLQLPQPVRPLPFEQPRAKTKDSLRIPMAVWAGAVAADQATTYLFSSRYPGILRERNLLIRGLDKNPAALVAAGTAIDAFTGWTAYRLLRNHPRLAKVVFYGAAAFRTYLAVHNIRMMQRARALAVAPGPTVR